MNTLNRIFLIIELIILLSFFSHTAAQWYQTNGPTSQECYSIIELSKSNRLLCSGTNSINISTNEGETWNKSNTSYPAIKFIEYSDSVLICLQGIRYNVYFSNDLGENWKSYPAELPKKIWDITKNSKGELFFASEEGVYYSDSFGNELVNLGLGDTYNYMLAINSNDQLYVNAYRTIYSYNDSTGSWLKLHTFNEHPLKMYIDSSDSIFVAVQNIMMVSGDNGLSWAKYKSDLPSYYTRSIIKDKQGNIFVSFNPEGVYYTNQYLDTWKPYNEGLSSVGCYSLMIDSKENLWVGTNHGIYKNEKSPSNWIPMNFGIAGANAEYLTYLNEELLICGSKWQIPYKSSNNGETWYPFGPPEKNNSDWKEIAIRQDGIILGIGNKWNIMDDRDYLYISKDSTKTWDKIITDSARSSIYFWDITFDQHLNIYVISNGRILKTSDLGKKWQNLWPSNTEYVYRLVLSEHDEIYAATTSNKIYYSADSGRTWLPRNNGLRSFNINTIVIDHNNDLYLGTDIGIFYSDDKGKNWVEIGLNDQNINSILSTVDNTIYTGTDNGIYYSNNRGKKWIEFNEGFSTLPNVSSIIVLDNNGLMAGCTEGGIFKNDAHPNNIELNEPKIVSKYNLYQNYPNPFNSNTLINFEIPKTGHTNLSIYNILGQKVQTLINKHIHAGFYTLNFNGENLPSGIYYYQLSSGTHVNTKKMIICK